MQREPLFFSGASMRTQAFLGPLDLVAGIQPPDSAATPIRRTKPGRGWAGYATPATSTGPAKRSSGKG